MSALMDIETYYDLKEELAKRGYAHEVDWANSVEPCKEASDFCIQFIWVVCNSGMKNQIAETIYKKILQAIYDKEDISEAFGHKGKVGAMKEVIKNQKTLFSEYLKSTNKIEFCKSLPWIGDITKYHLAKNLGVDCVKPDRHLVRIAEKYGYTPFDLCKRISDKTGDRLGAVDVVLWRAGNLKLI